MSQLLSWIKNSIAGDKMWRNRRGSRDLQWSSSGTWCLYQQQGAWDKKFDCLADLKIWDVPSRRPWGEKVKFLRFTSNIFLCWLFGRTSSKYQHVYQLALKFEVSFLVATQATNAVQCFGKKGSKHGQWSGEQRWKIWWFKDRCSFRWMQAAFFASSFTTGSQLTGSSQISQKTRKPRIFHLQLLQEPPKGQKKPSVFAKDCSLGDLLCGFADTTYPDLGPVLWKLWKDCDVKL